MLVIEYDGGPLDGQTRTIRQGITLPERMNAIGPVVSPSTGVVYSYVTTRRKRHGRVIFRYAGQFEHPLVCGE